METGELFPETAGGALQTRAPEWVGTARNRWGHPRVTARLVPEWDDHQGWKCGWFAQVDQAADEWHPRNPDAHRRLANYPWHRLDELPTSPRFATAAAIAARALKIVLEQMASYAEDGEAAQDIRTVQEQIETQARAWLVTGCG
jgi:hypothetical protein